MTEDFIDYKILIDAVKAVEDLRELALSATTFAARVDLARNAVIKFNKETGYGLKNTANAFRKMDADMADMTNTSKAFGNESKVIWDKAGAGAEGFGRKAVRSIDAVRIAMGALVAMLVFSIIQAFQNMAREALKGLKEIEAATFNIVNAEKKLSEQGIEIDTKGLDDLIKKLMILDPMLSKFQATELVSTLATKVAPAFGFGIKELEQMSEALTVLIVRNQALGKSAEEVQQQYITGLLSGKVTQGINQLGAKLTDQIVKEKAIEMQLVANAKAYDALNAKEQERVNILAINQLLTENTATELESLPVFFKTASGLIGTAQARFTDFMTELGVTFAPLLKEIFTTIIALLEAAIKSLENNKQAWQAFVGSLTIGAHIVGVLAEAFFQLNQIISKVGAAWYAFFGKIPAFKKIIDGLFPEKLFPDTPTGVKIDTEEAVQNLEELEQAIQDIKKTADQNLEDLNVKLTQKKEDLDLEYIRKAWDAEKDYLRKKEDINRDYERQVGEIKKKHREEDKKDEEKYQLALWELRMRYLMDLEDALHARDARQVIRLQKQYDLDKETLRRKHELEGKDREESQAAELEDAELKRQQRLEDAQIEYQQKLADQQLAKQRELDDLNVWYARELIDLQTAAKRKAQALIDNWIAEGKITEKGASDVYAILKKYFGPDGMADDLYKYMMDSLLQVSANAAMVAGQMALLGSIGGGVGGGGHTTPIDTESGGSTGGEVKIKKGRDAGLAPRPTGMFGSIPSSVPVNQIGRGNQGMSGSNLGRTGMEGAITVEVSLSPDLEARVVQNSMDGVANVISRVTNSK